MNTSSSENSLISMKDGKGDGQSTPDMVRLEAEHLNDIIVSVLSFGSLFTMLFYSFIIWLAILHEMHLKCYYMIETQLNKQTSRNAHFEIDILRLGFWDFGIFYHY